MKINTPGKLTDIMEDVLRGNRSSDGDTLVCKRCSKEYERGEWDFYNLCDQCFELFDSQKMRGRINNSTYIKYYENADDWIKDNPIT